LASHSGTFNGSEGIKTIRQPFPFAEYGYGGDFSVSER
jgi:hypothetical protein